MKTQSIDTHPKAEEIQITLLKKQSIATKFKQVCSLSETTIQLSKRAISRANQHLDTQAINLLFINLQYGGKIAERMKHYLEHS